MAKLIPVNVPGIGTQYFSEEDAAAMNQPTYDPQGNLMSPSKVSQGWEVLGGGESTIGQIYGGQTGEDLQAQKALEAQQSMAGITKDAYGNLVYNPPNESDIYKKQLSQFQAQIDSLDRLYATKKSELTNRLAQQSTGELGTQRGILAGSGMLGQVGGMAQTSELRNTQNERLNTGISSLDAEQEAAKQAIYGNVRSMAQSDYQSKIQAYSQGINATLDYLKSATERKANNISKIVKTAILQGVDLSNSNDNWVKKYAQELGVQPQAVMDEWTAQKSEADAQQAQAQAQAIKDQAALEKTQSETAQNQAQTYKLQHPEAVIKEVQGGLYDVTNKKWIVNPKIETTPGTPTPESIINNTITTLKDKITNINNLLTDKAISSAVGPNPLGRIGYGVLTGSTQNYIAGIEQLVSKDTLDTLINLKKAGGTLGALSDQERVMLQSSASRIGSWAMRDKNGKVKGYNVDEKSFKTELNKIKTLTERALKEAEGTNQGAFPPGTDLESLRLKYSY